MYLYCNEIFEEFDYLEDCFEDDDCEPMDIDNYYSDQEYCDAPKPRGPLTTR